MTCFLRRMVWNKWILYRHCSSAIRRIEVNREGLKLSVQISL